eukprot:1142845-Pelagomonas_calceolata.AAC.4
MQDDRKMTNHQITEKHMALQTFVTHRLAVQGERGAEQWALQAHVLKQELSKTEQAPVHS